MFPPNTIRYGSHSMTSTANPCNMSVGLPWLSIVLHSPTSAPALALSLASSLLDTRRSRALSSSSFKACLNATTHLHQEALPLILVTAFRGIYRLLWTIVASQHSKTMEQNHAYLNVHPLNLDFETL